MEDGDELSRRKILNRHLPALSALLSLFILLSSITGCEKKPVVRPSSQTADMVSNGENPSITLFLSGDVMTGRGIDQVLPHPGRPEIHEPYMKDARGYVEIAERVNGTIPAPVSFSYIWGDALDVLKEVNPDLRLINLETSITRSDNYREGKGIHYRMNPENVPVLASAGIDFCSLANNHILDWGNEGLFETIDTLREAGIKFAGAGINREEAETPAIFEIEGKGRVVVFSFCTRTSGVPSDWVAGDERPGVSLLEDLSQLQVERIMGMVDKVKREGDIVIASIHWGSNWGYRIPEKHREFAHLLIDKAEVDIIHGHSSHHPRPIEVYRGKPILYGCGDFINDYEGIGGYEQFRDDLVLMYLLNMDISRKTLKEMRMVPLQIKNFRLHRANREDAVWLQKRLNSESRIFGTEIVLTPENNLIVKQ